MRKKIATRGEKRTEAWRECRREDGTRKKLTWNGEIELQVLLCLLQCPFCAHVWLEMYHCITKESEVYLVLMARDLHSYDKLPILLLCLSLRLVVAAAEHLSRQLLYLSSARRANWAAAGGRESQAGDGNDHQMCIKRELTSLHRAPPVWLTDGSRLKDPLTSSLACLSRPPPAPPPAQTPAQQWPMMRARGVAHKSCVHVLLYKGVLKWQLHLCVLVCSL